MRENFEPKGKNLAHEILTRIILDPRNIHEKKFGTHEVPTKAQCHDSTGPTIPAMTRDLRNLAQSVVLSIGFVFTLLMYSC